MLATVGKPIAAVTLADLQAWTGTLAFAALAPASRARKIGAVKSLLSFAEKTGLLPFNVGAALRVPPVKNVLAERIFEEADVIRLIALEPDKRNHALLRLGYLAGLRICEICGLRWRDTKRRTGGGQITVFGKGGKTRVVVLPGAMWKELVELRGEAGDDDPVFRSQKGGALDRSQVHRDREAGGGARWVTGRRVVPLVAARARQPRARPRRPGASGAADGRARELADDIALRARAAERKLGDVPDRLNSHTPLRRRAGF